jgi:hypothetical protein
MTLPDGTISRHVRTKSEREKIPSPGSCCLYVIHTILVLILICLASCSARFPATIIIQNGKVLRGSASGRLGDDVSFTVNNIDGLACDGTMFILSSDANTEGTIECNNKRTGHFIANSKKASWVGEGKLDDGSRFVISIGR